VAALFRIIGRYPLMAFMVIGLGAGFLSPAVRPIAGAEVLPFGLPLHGVLERLLGVGFGAFVLTGADAGREAVVDLAQRSVGYFTRIYGSQALAPPDGGWPRALVEVAAVFVLQLVLFGLPKRSDSPGSFSTIGRTDITTP